jgi:uncharacterized protein
VEIDLSRIESEPLTFDEELQLAADQLDPSRVAAVGRVHLSGAVHRRGPDLLALGGDIEWMTTLLCGRCLEPVPWEGREHFEVELRPAMTDAEEEEVELDSDELDVVFLEEERLDLNALAVEQIELAMPMRVLCREDCAGLCPSCGRNRNLHGECGCADAEIDPRWSALAALKERDGSS